MQQVLRFGIPSLDEMLGLAAGVEGDGLPDEGGPGPGPSESRGGFQLRCSTERGPVCPVSVCIIGNDGAGKSVLAMHLAAEYLKSVVTEEQLRKQGASASRVLYVSLDLTLQRARHTWTHFALGYSDRVSDPFLRTPELDSLPELRIEPFQETHAPPARACVEYLDLRNESHGDDWSYINRLLATLPDPGGDARHLMVIDAVDGLELLGGARDAFGMTRERRSRLTQIIRAASPNTHLVFVVGESVDGGRQPEEYVSDLVVRVGSREDHGYSRRMLEIEKVRGQGHVRGAHKIAIRTGAGSTTGSVSNPDDPPVLHPGRRSPGMPRFQAYFYVFPTVHRMSRRLMEDQRKESLELAEAHFAPFFVHHLDEMLPGVDKAQRTLPDREQAEDDSCRIEWERGVPAQEPVSLIGEEGTLKSRLGRAFLSGAFRDERGGLLQGADGAGVAVLITTKQLDRQSLGRRMQSHLVGYRKELEPWMEERVLCRRLEIHHLSPSIFVHIVRQMVASAQRVLLGLAPHESLPHEWERAKHGYRIRLVIDNWTALTSMYPEIAEDRRILPYLLFLLRREGIPTVLIATEVQGFRTRTDLSYSKDLRDQAGLHVYTWRIPFFGESRVALQVNPPSAKDGPSVFVREVRAVGRKTRGVPANDSQSVRVNPELELYQGVHSGDLRYVETAVHLYGADRRSSAYFAEVGRMFDRLMGRAVESRAGGRAEPGRWGVQGGPVLHLEEGEDYEYMREFSELQGTSKFPNTVVLQVDEYWAKSKKHPLSLQSQADYLEARTLLPSFPEQGHPEPNMVEDPFLLYQPTRGQRALVESKGPEVDWSRLDVFQPVGYDLREHIARHRETVVKVPFTWDFGFLSVQKDRIRDLLEACGRKREREAWDRHCSGSEVLSWGEFARVLQLAALQDGSRKPFGVLDSMSDESLSCLALEAWGSAMRKPESLISCRHETAGPTLAELVQGEPDALYEACLVLAALFREGDFDRTLRRFFPTEHPASALALRSWFGTTPLTAHAHASILRAWREEATKDGGSEEGADAPSAPPEPEPRFTPVPLPGTRITRGDWFLAIARGSRSPRIGARVLDILCSHRANVLRIQSGIGLPVRGCAGAKSNRRIAELWTPIEVLDRDGSPRQLHYQELRDLGAWDAQDGRGRRDASWIWRSRIRDYERHARIWRRWLVSVCLDLTRLAPHGDRSGGDGEARDRAWAGWLAGHENSTRQLFDVRCQEFLETLSRTAPLFGE